jgi:DNA-binding MarR family transcriptional regulator
MEHFKNNAVWFLRAFTRMQINLSKHELEKQGLNEAGNPSLLFVLRYEMDHMTASQKELADELGISPSTVAISLKRMEKTGFIKKVQDKEDLRRNLITLTEKGLDFTDKADDIFNKIDHNIFKGFSGQEKDELTDHFRRMIQNLEEMGAKAPGFLRKFDKKDKEEE